MFWKTENIITLKYQDHYPLGLRTGSLIRVIGNVEHKKPLFHINLYKIEIPKHAVHHQTLRLGSVRLFCFFCVRHFQLYAPHTPHFPSLTPALKFLWRRPWVTLPYKGTWIREPDVRNYAWLWILLQTAL